MTEQQSESDSSDNIFTEHRAQTIFLESLRKVQCGTSKLFCALFILQWAAAIAAAYTIAPYNWIGTQSTIHIHLQAAIVLGFVINSFPLYLIWKSPTSALTRHLVAASQLLWSGLLVHLSGGRIETHFHVFGSLAFLAFYRDWKILLTATAVTGVDHLLRGIFWPQSVYGVLSASPWRTLEHALWVVFENIFLGFSCVKMLAEMRLFADRQAGVEKKNRQINQKIREADILRKELETALERSEEARKAKSVFLAHMSHEIRTPLNGIQGALHLLGRKQADGDQAQYLKVALRSCSALSSIVNDILDFSKIEAGKMELNEEYIDIREVIEETIETQLPRANEKKIYLTSVVDPDIPGCIKVDRVRLGQILLNLISNAVKFTAHGGVVVKVHCTKRLDEECRIRFEVNDTGIGIPEDKAVNLFQAFQQADASTTKQFGGTGLGLAICKQLVQLMRGEIGISSVERQGSSFWFEISVHPAREDIESHRYFQLSQSGVRLLLLGSDLQYQGIILEQIRSWGLAAEILSDFHDFLETLKEASASGVTYTAVILTSSPPPAFWEQLRNLMTLGEAHANLPICLLLRGEDEVEIPADLLHRNVVRCRRPTRQSTLFDSLINLIAHARGFSGKMRNSSHASKSSTKENCTGARVLLAEDNEVNQFIACELLKAHDITPMVVGNGELAVKAASSQTFDLILLDYHLPIMDGLDAAKNIRDREQELGLPRVPIVALTADVTTESMELCRRVGMDRFLSKPLDPMKLSAVVREFLGHQAAPAGNPDLEIGSPTISSEPEVPPIMLDDLSSRYCNNAKLIQMVLTKFSEQLTKDSVEISEIIRAGDPHKLAERAHALKGACSASSAHLLREVAAELEQLGKVGNMSAAQEHLPLLQQRAGECVEFLKVRLTKEEGP